MPPSSDVSDFRKFLASAKNIVILSGAGISAPSGIATYRSSGESSLWANPSVVKYSLHTTFQDDPSGSWKFYHHRRLISLEARPNDGHLSLAALNLPSVVSRIMPLASAPLHVTQNLDELSLRSLELLPDSLLTESSERLIQMHGSLFRTRCLSCKHIMHSYRPFLASSFKALNDRETTVNIPIDELPRCGGDDWAGSNRYGRCGNLLRPDVVWFGEVPPLMGEIARKLSGCDLLLVIGTSSIVHPAASFASQVKEHGGKVAIFNLDNTNKDDEADFLFLGSCDMTLPDVLDITQEVENLSKQYSERISAHSDHS